MKQISSKFYLLMVGFALFTGQLFAQSLTGDKALQLGSPSSEEEDLPFTIIEFAETTYDFGEIPQGEEVQHTFRFTNTGEHDLVLEDVKPSCTCTTLEWPKHAIKPGESSEIEMAFSTEEKSGEQVKYLTIRYNGNPPIERVSLRGFVKVTQPSLPEEKE